MSPLSNNARPTQNADIESIVRFVRSHGLQCLPINGHVHFECADGVRHVVRSMGEAREILGY